MTKTPDIDDTSWRPGKRMDTAEVVKIVREAPYPCMRPDAGFTRYIEKKGKHLKAADMDFDLWNIVSEALAEVAPTPRSIADFLDSFQGDLFASIFLSHIDPDKNHDREYCEHAARYAVAEMRAIWVEPATKAHHYGAEVGQSLLEFWLEWCEQSLENGGIR